MNQLAVVPQGQSVVTAPEYSMRDMERMAIAFSQSGLFGVKTPDQALALCLIAHAEGRHPALAARDYHIIEGKPSKTADAMLRDFQMSGGKVQWDELSDSRVCATFSHPIGGTVTVDWDMERAKKAQLGGKAMWSKYPRQMLRSRVVSEGVRTVFPGATSGFYVPEEIADFGADAPATPPAPPAKRARDLKGEKAPEPAASEDPAEDVEAKWAATYIAKVEKAADTAALDKFVSSKAELLDELREKRPELHTDCLAAVVRRRGQLEADAWAEDEAGEA